MIIPRVIPCLLLKGSGLVKGTRFGGHKYVGDPLNAIRIFNEKRVDELLFLDITACAEKRIPKLELVERIAEECFMPFGVGGGIRDLADIRAILKAGAEKVCINTAAVETPRVIQEAADTFGSQSVVVSIDVKRPLFRGPKAFVRGGRSATGLDPVALARKVQDLGAGEILLTSIDREGTGEGYDLELVRGVAEAVTIPVIASGGAGRIEDFKAALNLGRADAVSAGTMFVFHGPKRAVLISYPERGELEAIFEGLAPEERD